MIAEFSIIPIGKRESLSSDIADVIEIVDESQLPYDFGSMGTTIEGDWDQVIGLIKDCRDRLLENNLLVYLTIKVDDRKESQNRIIGKIRSVEEKLGKSLRK